MNKWINFLRKYGPIPRNDNMYDETIQRVARRNKIKPILFEHPYQDRILSCFREEAPVSVILTGTAGDGKTHLCRQVWNELGGEADKWASNDPYLSLEKKYPAGKKSIHFIRDLSGWVPQQGSEWSDHPKKELIINTFCNSIFAEKSDDIFLIAGNDGQLVESFRRLNHSDNVEKTRRAIEELLVEDRQNLDGVRLQFFNLSRGSSAELFDRAVKAFIEHEGWLECFKEDASDTEVFGPRCPIRYNYELLKTELVQKRIRVLLELCDHNGFHLPIRQILLLLTNAVLGHPNAKDRVMRAVDVPKIIQEKQEAKGCLYNNVFGGNLSPRRQSSITVFNYFGRFQIGYETTNRIDNILIFGGEDEVFSKLYNLLVANDKFYGEDKSYIKAKKDYLEAADENDESTERFLEMLIRQRRGLFFKIPEEKESEYKLWSLTVFKFAGEYLDHIINRLDRGKKVKSKILSRLVIGINRIFTGMLINDGRYVYLATSGNYSQAKVSRIFLDKISVPPSKGERVTIEYDSQKKRAYLTVYFSPEIHEIIELNLVRFEFLSRVAEDGALPASFSKECYEDILAFKSRLIGKYEKLQIEEGVEVEYINLKVLSLTAKGQTDEKIITVQL